MIGEAFPMKRFLLSPVSGRTARQYLYALVCAPLGIAGLVYAVVTLAVGGALSFTFIGLPLIATAIFLAKKFGGVQRRLARTLLGVDIEAPHQNTRWQSAHGLLAKLGAALGDLAAWRAQAYLLVRAPLGVAYIMTLVLGVVEGLGMVLYPVWWSLFDPENKDSHGVAHHSAIQFGSFYFDSWPRAFLATAMGVVAVYAGVWLLKFWLWLDTLLMKSLLGPTRSEVRVEELTVSRAAAVDDSAARLRRIERDLHDGAQARLVALGMQLVMLKDSLGGEQADGFQLESSRGLVDQAQLTAKTAIAELRDLVRGIHPPTLDQGLETALRTLTANGPIPADLTVRVPDPRPAAAIETMAYFCAAELLTNAAKHGRATRASVTIDADGRHLTLRVRDDGRGGARMRPGGGLAGLMDRVGTVDGTVEIDSPDGGPTVVTVALPMKA